MNDQVHVFYWWRSCSQCRDAKNALEGMGFRLELRDFFAEPLSEEELRMLLNRVPVSELFSWRSPSSIPYRARRDELTIDELVAAMLGEPRLIRRPILVPPTGQAIVGFNQRIYASLQAEMG